jgi:hypothetical protein
MQANSSRQVPSAPQGGGGTGQKGRRPGSVVIATSLLGLCVVMQIVLLIAAGQDSEGGYVTTMIQSVALLGIGAYSWVMWSVWRGWRWTRPLAWIVALLSSPVCGILGIAVVNAGPPPATDGSAGVVGSGGALGFAVIASVLCLMMAIVLIMTPSAGRYFRAWTDN